MIIVWSEGRKIMLMRILCSLLFYDLRKRWAEGSLLYPSNETWRLELMTNCLQPGVDTLRFALYTVSFPRFNTDALCRWLSLSLSDSVLFPSSGETWDLIIIYDVNAATHTKLVCWTNPLTQTWSRKKKKKKKQEQEENKLPLDLHEHENEEKKRGWHVVHGKHHKA